MIVVLYNGSTLHGQEIHYFVSTQTSRQWSSFVNNYHTGAQKLVIIMKNIIIII